MVHAGHKLFFDRHPDVAEVLVLGSGFRDQFRNIAKDIRALPPEQNAQFLRQLVPHARIRVIEPSDLPGVVTADALVVPDEHITRSLAAEHTFETVQHLTFDKTFLRWDRDWSQAQRPANFDGAVTSDALPRALLEEAQKLAGLSSDWWRRVGAIAVRDGQVLGSAWNHHLPSENAPYIDGDPRDGFSRGVRADLSTAIHAEASIIAQAARDGVPLRDADMYVLTFPCPGCARLIAETGFRRCFFGGAYSVLEGEEVLRSSGVEIFWVDLQAAQSTSSNDSLQALLSAHAG